MKYSLFYCQRKFVEAFSSIMECFVACFRHRDSRRSRSLLVAETSYQKCEDAVVSENRWTPPSLSDDSLFNRKGNQACGSPQPSIDYRELMDEVSILKACGTLLQTPDEIRYSSAKMETSPLNDETLDSTDLHSWLSVSITNDLCSEGQSENENQDSYLQKRNAIDESDDQTDGIHAQMSAQCRTKSVCFKSVSGSSSSCSSGTPASAFSGDPATKIGSSGSSSRSKWSPYPTPHKLNDVVDTPGTVFPANHGIEGGNIGVRAQYVYPVLNPVRDFPHQTALKGLPSLPDSHSKENICSNVSPKWKNGNGIPNTTTKYKEDQRVKWHATPFEQRLEKALCEGLVARREQSENGQVSIACDDVEEHNTTISLEVI